ncbi:5148_t:CDS:2 [Dentiscutata erythropus]|uniref:5148_t:CDS:1 n=1 Tax=Dentiscutata erythropus TaxID=1348616 RepID=A0A9N9HHJ3_9GLOM|nr:5148_t:CDS:2 [Dentiscutata erythropus]
MKNLLEELIENDKKPTNNETLSDNNISINSNSDTEYDNKLSAKPKSRKNESWVWHYFRRKPLSRKWKTRRNCKVIIKDKKSPNGEREYGQLVKTQGSTGNFQSHLNTHRITKPIEKNNTAVQPMIGEMFQHAAKQNPRQNESIERALVTWIITNSQPLHVLQSKSFIKLINTLNPYYELPSNKQIKARIHQSYNYSVERLKALFKTELKTYGLIENIKEKLHMALNYYWDAPIDSSLVAMLLDPQYKAMKQLSSWERNKAISLLQEKYNLFSTKNESVINLPNEEQEEDQMKLFSIMFGSDARSTSVKNEVERYIKIDQKFGNNF